MKFRTPPDTPRLDPRVFFQPPNPSCGPGHDVKNPDIELHVASWLKGQDFQKVLQGFPRWSQTPVLDSARGNHGFRLFQFPCYVRTFVLGGDKIWPLGAWARRGQELAQKASFYSDKSVFQPQPAQTMVTLCTTGDTSGVYHCSMRLPPIPEVSTNGMQTQGVQAGDSRARHGPRIVGRWMALRRTDGWRDQTAV